MLEDILSRFFKFITKAIQLIGEVQYIQTLYDHDDNWYYYTSY